MMISAENTPLKPAHNEIRGMIFTDTRDSNMPKKTKRSKLSAAVVIQRGTGLLLASPLFQKRGALRSGLQRQVCCHKILEEPVNLFHPHSVLSKYVAE